MISLETIILVLENGEKLSRDIIFQKTRQRPIVFARQLIMYFCKEYNIGSLGFIGKEIGNKDHATVLHAHKTICNLIDTDKYIANKVSVYSKQIEISTIFIEKKNRLIDLSKLFKNDLNLLETRFLELKMLFNDLEEYISITDNPVLIKDDEC